MEKIATKNRKNTKKIFNIPDDLKIRLPG